MRETKDKADKRMTDKIELGRLPDWQINEMLDHFIEIDREECGIDREHMHTLRCLIGSYSDLWEHIKRLNGVIDKTQDYCDRQLQQIASGDRENHQINIGRRTAYRSVVAEILAHKGGVHGG